MGEMDFANNNNNNDDISGNKTAAGGGGQTGPTAAQTAKTFGVAQAGGTSFDNGELIVHGQPAEQPSSLPTTTSGKPVDQRENQFTRNDGKNVSTTTNCPKGCGLKLFVSPLGKPCASCGVQMPNGDRAWR
jgi:hypothetical protein